MFPSQKFLSANRSLPVTHRISVACLLAVSVFASILGCEPATNRPSGQVSSQSTGQDSSEGRVGIRINTMMCVDGCFQGVKELLEKRPGVTEVTLAPQKVEGTIDNSMIFVSYKGQLDRKEMERLILGAGFEKIEFVDSVQ
jgi:copper chaperone CopZ